MGSVTGVHFTIESFWIAAAGLSFASAIRVTNCHLQHVKHGKDHQMWMLYASRAPRGEHGRVAVRARKPAARASEKQLDKERTFSKPCIFVNQ